jgi:hypothetical protein
LKDEKTTKNWIPAGACPSMIKAGAGMTIKRAIRNVIPVKTGIQRFFSTYVPAFYKANSILNANRIWMKINSSPYLFTETEKRTET